MEAILTQPLEIWMGFGVLATLGVAYLKWVRQRRTHLSEKTPVSIQEANHDSIHREPIPAEPILKPLREAMVQTREGLWGRIRNLMGSQASFLPTHIDEIEEILYTSDLGPRTVGRLLEQVRSRLGKGENRDLSLVRTVLRDEMIEILSRSATVSQESSLLNPGSFTKPQTPLVWMIVGVNGAGKTTTIGKLAHRFAKDGLKVLVAAGDTFRAAAGDQLKVWSQRAQVEIFSPEGVDSPSAVAFDACQKAMKENFEILLVDTAGRLHTQKPLMEELKKMKRVIEKVIPGAPHEILIVLDASSGQNALIQARQFHEALGLTGVILTKLDGTAKGGVALGIAHELALPIRLIGVGEKTDDLRSFEVQEFVDSIVGDA